jgi:hypothetical protein
MVSGDDFDNASLDSRHVGVSHELPCKERQGVTRGIRPLIVGEQGAFISTVLILAPARYKVQVLQTGGDSVQLSDIVGRRVARHCACARVAYGVHVGPDCALDARRASDFQGPARHKEVV